jgi:AcrR family transcriptional regulator
MAPPQGRSLLTDGDETAFAGRLLALARRTALEEGAGALSTVRLARDAGVSRVAVEKRFRTRSELLAALQADILGEAAEAIVDALGGMSPRRPQALETLCRLWVAHWLDQPALFRVAFPEGSAPPRTGPRDPLAPLDAYFTEGLDGGDGAARADLLLCALHGIVLSQLGSRPGDWTEPGDLVALAVAAARG